MKHQTMEMRWQLCWAIPALIVSTIVEGKAVEHSERTSTNLETMKEINEDVVGQGRVLGSFVFPFFPQYHGVNYGDTMELMTKADTVGYFVVRHTITVRPRGVSCLEKML